VIAGDVEWGTVGEWVSGIGALAAAIAAVGVPWFLWRRQDNAERRWRSLMVSAWADLTEPRHNDPKLIC
jgi:hypothetical protein